MTTHWNAFLPIGGTLTSDEPGLDPAWAAAMGVDKDALLVLRRVRRDVLPLVRGLEKSGRLLSFSFLVHDRGSGVPCPPEDAASYIHLRLEASWKRDLKVEQQKVNRWRGESVENLKLSVRTSGLLHNAGVQSVDDLVRCSWEKLLEIVGNKALKEVREVFAERGFDLLTGLEWGLPAGWVYVTRVEPSSEEREVQRRLHEQSVWYFRLIEGAGNMSDVDLLRHVGQSLHYFANMAQMVVR